MKIVVFGTGPFCVPTFQWLLDSEHDVAAVVTRPIEDAGKRRKTIANPVRQAAEQSNVIVLAPESCNTAEFVEQLKSYKADLFFVCDYGQILSKTCLETAGMGGINLHGSLLPRYRGAAPIQWAIYNGDEELGVSVLHMTPKMDADLFCRPRAKLLTKRRTPTKLKRYSAKLASMQSAIQSINYRNGIAPAKSEPNKTNHWQLLRPE